MKRLLAVLLLITINLPLWAQDTVSAGDYVVYSAWLNQQANQSTLNKAIYVSRKTVPIYRGRQIWYTDTTMTRETAKNYRPDSLLVWDSLLRRPEWEALLKRYNAQPAPDSARLDKKQFVNLPVPVYYWPDDADAPQSTQLASKNPRNDLKQILTTQQNNRLIAPSYYKLSRVTYSADGKRALFCGGYYCGALCGQGDLVFLEQVAGQWKVYTVRKIWVS